MCSLGDVQQELSQQAPYEGNLSIQTASSHGGQLTDASPNVVPEVNTLLNSPSVISNDEEERGSTSHSRQQSPRVIAKISRAQLNSLPQRERSAFYAAETENTSHLNLVGYLSPKRSRIAATEPDFSATNEPPRKRPKVAQVEFPPEGSIHVQDRRCFIGNYKNYSKCLACVAKKTGDACRFVGIRGFRIGKGGNPIGPALFHGLPISGQSHDVSLQFSRDWYRPPDEAHVRRIKQSVARVLLPKIQSELAEILDKNNVIRRPREMDVRVTCDRCLTSIFSTSYLCTLCGREFCVDCLSGLKNINHTPTDIRFNVNSYTKCCYRRPQYSAHDASSFLPVSRLDAEELKQNILEMKQVLGDIVFEGPSVSGVQSTNKAVNMNSTLEEGNWDPLNTQEVSGDAEFPRDRPPGLTHQQGTNVAHTALNPQSTCDWSRDSSLSPLSSDMSTSEAEAGDDTVVITRPVIDPITGARQDPAGIDSLPIDIFSSEIDEELFQRLWKDGNSIVVHGLLEKMAIRWTPDYFIQHYGEELCFITDCDSQVTTESTVARFFAEFGKYTDRNERILKLKDWPPTSDFKETFPSLFTDFQSAVPVPDYTRRDGFYNVSTHFPTNVVAPDMGPKMYNAFASRENGHGSTRLHMDMADAVNIMLYASPPPGETVGVAVWDIYPSTASNDIRRFLQEEFPLDKSPIKYVDPIHSQYFYLTPKLRKKMFDKYKVRGWRIYQRPGDAVFIPAGCAHQVCNLADCMKVAVDFVSPENLDRCGQLTEEFRQENKQVTWKEDILQLANMCWNAWINTKQLEKEMRAN